MDFTYRNAQTNSRGRMKSRDDQLTLRFADFIPSELEQGILYISMQYATTSHLCCCGCGNRVVLPLHPTDWWLRFDGKTVTIRPSVGNWSFECRSHYLITANRIQWAEAWNQEEISAGRRRDREQKAMSSDTTRPSGKGKVYTERQRNNARLSIKVRKFFHWLIR